MSNTPHTLGEEFHGQLDKIHQAKAADPAFARLLEEYDDVNDRIHRAETRIDAISDTAENALRKRRLEIKDSIAKAIEAA